MNRTHWTAVCAYPGHDQFRFYSPTFTVECWADLETTAADTVAAEWAKISPHPPPGIVELIPGHLEHVPQETR